MLLNIPIPIGWFTDELSWEICKEFKLRKIGVPDWGTSGQLHLLSYHHPRYFDVLSYGQADRLHVLLFTSFYDGKKDILFHPDKYQVFIKRRMKRLIKYAN